MMMTCGAASVARSSSFSFTQQRAPRAVAIADAIRRAVVEADLVADGRPVPLSVSIGVASVNGVFDPVDLFRQADEHLYRAKSGGRDCIVFDGQELGRQPA